MQRHQHTTNNASKCAVHFLHSLPFLASTPPRPPFHIMIQCHTTTCLPTCHLPLLLVVTPCQNNRDRRSRRSRSRSRSWDRDRDRRSDRRGGGDSSRRGGGERGGDRGGGSGSYRSSGRQQRDNDGWRHLETRLQDAAATAAVPPSAAVLASAASAPDPPPLPEDPVNAPSLKLSLGRVFSVSSSSLAAEFCANLVVGSHEPGNVKFERNEYIQK